MKQLQLILLVILFANTAQSQAIKDCENCLSKTIKQEQIKNLSIDELRFLTNDLYARKGYKFKSGEIDNYYSDKKWYKPINGNEKIVYNTIEQQNLQLFKQRTAELKTDRDKLMNELKIFKTTILANEKVTLKNKYSFTTENEQYKNITEALIKLNLEDVNWSKNKGLYSVTIDNGDYVMTYELKLEKNHVTVQYSSRGGSDIAESLYPSEFSDEFSFWWEFEWKNDTMKFIKMNVAG